MPQETSSGKRPETFEELARFEQEQQARLDARIGELEDRVRQVEEDFKRQLAAERSRFSDDLAGRLAQAELRAKADAALYARELAERQRTLQELFKKNRAAAIHRVVQLLLAGRLWEQERGP